MKPLFADIETEKILREIYEQKKAGASFEELVNCELTCRTARTMAMALVIIATQFNWKRT